jgi:hypothetical protein
LPFIVTWPAELQSPLQPPKVEPPEGVALRVTVVPMLKVCEQSEPPAPQVIPGPRTVPLPEPEVDTVSTGLSGESGSNVAWQLRLPVMTTTPSLQSPSPLQPAKTQPDEASASSETVVPEAKLVEQSPPQSMPAGLLVTVPLPDLLTDSVYCVPSGDPNLHPEGLRERNVRVRDDLSARWSPASWTVITGEVESRGTGVRKRYLRGRRSRNARP